MTMFSTIKNNSIRIATVILAAASVASITPAGAQDKAAATACPANFFSLATIWYNNANASNITFSSGAMERTTDRPGWTLADLCQHNDTGDIHIFDFMPTSSQAAVRN